MVLEQAISNNIENRRMSASIGTPLENPMRSTNECTFARACASYTRGMRRNNPHKLDLRRIDLKWLLVAPGLTLLLLGLALAQIFRIPMPADIRVEILVPATLTAFLIAVTLASWFKQHSSSQKIIAAITSRPPSLTLSLQKSSGSRPRCRNANSRTCLESSWTRFLNTNQTAEIIRKRVGSVYHDENLPK